MEKIEDLLSSIEKRWGETIEIKQKNGKFNYRNIFLKTGSLTTSIFSYIFLEKKKLRPSFIQSKKFDLIDKL